MRRIYDAEGDTEKSVEYLEKIKNLDKSFDSEKLQYVEQLLRQQKWGEAAEIIESFFPNGLDKITLTDLKKKYPRLKELM